MANRRDEAGRLRYKNEHGTRLTSEWQRSSNARSVWPPGQEEVGLSQDFLRSGVDYPCKDAKGWR